MVAEIIFETRDQKEIKKTFEDYFNAVEKRNNAKTLTYIYPRLFDHFPKKKMLQAMDRMKADTSILVDTSDGSLTNISETLEIDEIKYALVKYVFKMKMTITEVEHESADDEEGGEEEGSTRADDMFEILKAKYGSKNVTYDRANGSLEIKTSNAMYAIHDRSYKGWKFLENKDSMAPVLKKLLPKKVLKQL